jgi:pseudaminic acid biosynthesis-associated methylase
MTSRAFKTDQEEFWAGDFGRAYSKRNTGPRMLAANCALLSEIIRRTAGVTSILEFGANIGMNLKAFEILLPDAEQAAVEINSEAAAALRSTTRAQVFERSMLDFTPARAWDLVLTKGVLIHIAPSELEHAYATLVASAAKYIAIAEYYNPTPVEVDYRGHQGRLFKRDFAGELLKQFPSLRLLDYGFAYHGDPNFAADDITWFLLEKRA